MTTALFKREGNGWMLKVKIKNPGNVLRYRIFHVENMFMRDWEILCDRQNFIGRYICFYERLQAYCLIMREDNEKISVKIKDKNFSQILREALNIALFQGYRPQGMKDRTEKESDSGSESEIVHPGSVSDPGSDSEPDPDSKSEKEDSPSPVRRRDASTVSSDPVRSERNVLRIDDSEYISKNSEKSPDSDSEEL
jgi:hypothetical protein